MRAWVEWHFADFGRLKKKGRSFFCNSCKENVQKARMCHEDSWNVRGLTAHVPIDFLDVSSGFNFCPAKIYRDDVEFVMYMQHLWVGWKSGQLLDDGNFSIIDEETICDLYDMINLWERTEREMNLFRLGMMLCGDPDENKSNPGPKK